MIYRSGIILYIGKIILLSCSCIIAPSLLAEHNNSIHFSPDLYRCAGNGISNCFPDKIINNIFDIKIYPQSADYTPPAQWNSDKISLRVPVWPGIAVLSVLLIILAGCFVLMYKIKVRTLALRRMNLDFERISDGFAALDRNWNFSYVNTRAGELFGRRPEELTGKNIWTVFPEGADQSIRQAYEKAMAQDKTIHLEDYYAPWNRWFENIIYPSNEGLSIYFHDITARKKTEAELFKMNRALRALCECNQALAHVADEPELLNAVCRIVVEIGGYRLAWVGYKEYNEDRSVRPVAQAGYEAGYLEKLGITWADTERGRGPTGTGIRTGRIISARHILTDPDFEPWRAEALKRGYASSIVLPLSSNGETFGALNIYSAEPDAFNSDEIEMLTGLSNDLTFGILSHRTRIEHRHSEEQRRAALQRFADIVEFLPDATFVIDHDKKLIAWNKACEDMTGVKKSYILGQGNYAYSEPFFGERRPILIDLLDMPMPKVESTYKYIRRKENRLYAESFAPRLRAGQGAHLWGVASPLYDQNGSRCGAIETMRDVTEQKLIEEALHASDQKYRELVMLANSIILRWLPDGRITFMNEFGLKFFGYTIDEITGRHVVGTIVPDNESTGRDLRPLMKEICNDPGKFERNINENMRSNGERVWIDWMNKVVSDDNGQIKEIMSIGSDITSRKMAEEKAKLSAKLVYYLSKYANDFIILLDENFRFIEVNERTEDFYGYTREELIGMHASQFRAPEAKGSFLDQVKIAQVSGNTLFETMHQTKAGKNFPVEINLRAIDNEGKRFYQAVIRDISERKNAEEQVRKLNDDLRRHAEYLEKRVSERTAELAAAMIKAQEADRIKSAFLATMSHELRTPLNSIIGFTGIMLQGLAGPLNPEQQKQMTMVQNSSRHLLDLINDVLDISKIEAGQLNISLNTFALRPSIEKVVKMVSPAAVKKGIDLQISISFDDGRITADQRRLEQVILNLLSNAIKFTDQGYVRVSSFIENRDYVISFSDTGIGIEPDKIPDLFQPFYQVNSGITRKIEGTGLGLSISRKLLDMMGGSISVESRFGQGSTFTIRFPGQAGV